MKNAGEIFRLFSKRKWQDRGRRFLVLILLPLFVFQATSLNFLALEMMSARAAEGEMVEAQVTEEPSTDPEQEAEPEAETDEVLAEPEAKAEELATENVEVLEEVVTEELASSVDPIADTAEEISETDIQASEEQPAIEEENTETAVVETATEKDDADSDDESKDNSGKKDADEDKKDVPVADDTTPIKDENESDDEASVEVPVVETPVVEPIIVENPVIQDPTLGAGLLIEAVNNLLGDFGISQETAPTPKEAWSMDGNKAITNNNVELGKTYVAPQNDQVTVTFTKLPENPGTLSIEEITLTDEQIASLGAISSKAYDITSDMADGSFAYELSLPKPANKEDVQIKFAESISEFKNAETISGSDLEKSTDSVSATLDHFTVFVIAEWNFPDTPGDAIADGGVPMNSAATITVLGGSTITGYGAAGVTTYSARANNWDGGSGTKFWRIMFDSTGFKNLKISSKQRSSATGPRDFKMQYKIGTGGTWTDFGPSGITVADNFSSGTVSNISLPSDADNQSDVRIRWIMTSNAAVNGSPVAALGASNIDDIVVTGDDDMIPPIITLNGSDPMESQYGGLYSEPGAICEDASDGIIAETIGGDAVDNSTLGSYIVTYNCSDAAGNAATQVTRTVNVVDTTAPTIPTGGTPNGIHIPTNDFDFDWDDSIDASTITYEYQATTDPAEVGGVLISSLWSSGVLASSMIHSSGAPDGTWYWQVRAIDSFGNTSAWSPIWDVTIDTQAPVISLIGANPQIIEGGASSIYTELGATVTDNIDTGLTAIIDASAVNLMAVGSYTVTYNAVDAAGNAAIQVTRTVNVIDTTAPNGGSIDYNNGYTNITPQTISYVTGSDISGLNLATGKIQRRVGDTNGSTCINWGSWQDLVFETDGSYIDSSLQDGKCYRYRYIIADTIGNVATYGPAGTLKIDTSVPVSADDYDGLWHNADVTVNLSTDSGFGSETRLLGCYALESSPNCSLAALTGWVSGPNSVSVLVSGEGIFKLRYRVRDEAGNAETPINEVLVKIDKTAPVVSGVQAVITGTWNDYFPYIKGDQEFRVRSAVADSTLSGLNTSSCEYSLDNVVWSAGSFNVSTQRCIADVATAPDGAFYAVNIRVKDVAGNLGTGTATDYTIDSDNPSTSAIAVSPDNSGYTDTDPDVSGSISDTISPIIKCQYRYRTSDIGSGVGAWSAWVNGTWTASAYPKIGECTTSLSGLTDGVSYDFSMRGQDTVGHFGGGAFFVTKIVDVTAPSVDAGTDKHVNAIFTQDATASDAVSGIATYAWTQVSGPGTVIFGTPNADDTTVAADADGTYVLRLTVTDVATNSAFDEFTLIWDVTPPVITLLGDNPLIIEEGDSFTDPGATALDNIDGDITSQIVVTGLGLVDVDEPGDYLIDYDVQDIAGNAAITVTRTVQVEKMKVSAVDDLKAKYDSENRCVKLSWNLNRHKADETRIYRSESQFFDADSYTRIGEQPASDHNFSDCKVVSGKQYFYKVIVIGDDHDRRSEVKKVSITIPESGLRVFSDDFLNESINDLKNVMNSDKSEGGNPLSLEESSDGSEEDKESFLGALLFGNRMAIWWLLIIFGGIAGIIWILGRKKWRS